MKLSADAIYWIVMISIFCLLFIYMSARDRAIWGREVMSEEQFEKKYMAWLTITSPVAKAEIKRIERELTKLMDGIKPTDEMLKVAYHATKGKIPIGEASVSLYDFQHVLCFRHYESWRAKTSNEFRLGYDTPLSRKKYNIAYLKFLKWYDQTLRDNGIEFPLMCVEHPREEREYDRVLKKDRAIHVYYYQDRKEISQCEDVHEMICFWEPLERNSARKKGFMTLKERIY